MTTKKKPGNAGSGSPSAGEPLYLVVGSLRRPHGVRGELVMEVITDFPERLKANTKVFVGDSHQPMTLASARAHNEGLIVKFKNVDTPEDAARYRNQLVCVHASDRPKLPKGQYYYYELIGFAVVDEQDESLGTLTEIMQTGANDVYVVTRPDGGEVLLPNISSVILDIETDRRLIRVHLLDGLIEERES